MSTTKRLRRHSRTGGRWLTDAQYARLATGLVIPGEGFTSQEQEKAAWALHRTELMATESGPGVRPHGFFVHDLGATPRRWFDQVGILLNHKLIDATEAMLIERVHQILHPDYNPEHCKRLDGRAAVAAAWHRWRGRPEIAERWEELAALAARINIGDQ